MDIFWFDEIYRKYLCGLEWTWHLRLTKVLSIETYVSKAGEKGEGRYL